MCGIFTFLFKLKLTSGITITLSNLGFASDQVKNLIVPFNTKRRAKRKMYLFGVTVSAFQKVLWPMSTYLSTENNIFGKKTCSCHNFSHWSNLPVSLFLLTERKMLFFYKDFPLKLYKVMYYVSDKSVFFFQLSGDNSWEKSISFHL